MPPPPPPPLAALPCLLPAGAARTLNMSKAKELVDSAIAGHKARPG